MSVILGSCIFPISQMRKLRLEEVNSCPRSLCQRQDLNSDPSSSKP